VRTDHLNLGWLEELVRVKSPEALRADVLRRWQGEARDLIAALAASDPPIPPPTPNGKGRAA
jgi:hypothetical protein